jgi:hypothetical protein
VLLANSLDDLIGDNAVIVAPDLGAVPAICPRTRYLLDQRYGLPDIRGICRGHLLVASFLASGTLLISGC